MVGVQPQKHLQKIEDDQSINGIETIDDTVKNEAGRKWFISQAITPVVVMGGYSDDTGKIVLQSPSWRDSMVPNSSHTTASAAALTLTCATGHRYRVYYAGARNATQATNLTLSGVIGGNTWTSFNCAGSVSTQTTIPAIGGIGQTDAAAGWAGSVNEIWLNAADTLTMTLTVYAAGNNTEHLFMFEDYTL